MTERVPCKTSECQATILPTTADDTGGYCRPCVRKQKNREWEEYVRKNKKIINPFEGIKNPLEILKIIHAPKNNDPLLELLPYHKKTEEVYQELSSKELENLLDYIINLLTIGNHEKAEEIAGELSVFRSINMDKCLIKFLNHNIYPEFIFKNASPSIRNQLIDRIESEDRNLILTALAWIGDREVVQLFNRWRLNPPEWSNTLYIPPETYSKVAGWELDTEGAKRNLYFKECYPLVLETNPHISRQHTVLSDHATQCPWCSQTLTVFFQLDLKDPHLNFIPLEQDCLEVIGCEQCNCYGNIYFEFDEFGDSHWSDYNTKPGYLPNDHQDWELLKRRSLALSTTPRTAYHASSWFLPINFSQIGGHPTWIQDAEYPECPKCNRTMMFLGQVSCEDIEEFGEGIYYLFLCTSCRMTATSYQQS